MKEQKKVLLSDYNKIKIEKQKKKEYKPYKKIVRTYNSKTESYEYEEKVINHKLNWENTNELYKNNLRDEEK